MEKSERSQDVYEQFPFYPKPPLIELPDFSDPEILKQAGFKPNRFIQSALQFLSTISRFRSFYEQLPTQLESQLRRSNLRLPGLFSPVISATMALKDDPRCLNGIDRAVTLIIAAYQFHSDLLAGRLDPDRYEDQTLEMGQYPNLFGTSLILDGRGARVFKSSCTSQITVIAARRFYILKIGSPIWQLDSGQLKTALLQIDKNSREKRRLVHDYSPGILTCASNAVQFKAFARIQKHEINRIFLSTLRHSFFTLCLDLDSRPNSLADAALYAHSANYANRWFHSSQQIVVFGNAKACIICNFTAYLDGNTMMRSGAELQKRAANCSIEVKRNSGIQPYVVTELKWLPDARALQRSRMDVQLILDNQQATFEIPEIGRKFFSKYEIVPVAAFIIALHLAVKHLAGKLPSIEQFLALSRYRCMDLTTVAVTTPEVRSFVDYIENRIDDRDQAILLLKKAIESQMRECRNARRYLSLPVIFALFLRSRSKLARYFILVISVPAIFLLKRIGLFSSMGRRDIIVSHPEIYSEVPILGRPGIRLPYVKYFGLHYQIDEDHIVLTVMPGLTWNIPNAELIAELESCLKKLQVIAENAEEKSKSHSDH